MDFLEINGLTVPIAFGQAKVIPMRSTKPEKNFYGRRRAVTRKMDFGWSFQTTPLTFEDAEAVIGLLEGQGHHFDFQADFWSDAGLGPEGGFTASAGSSSGGPYTSYGKQAFHDSVGTEYVIYDAKLGDRYTVMHWRAPDGGTWQHAAITHDGTTATKYINGTSSAAALTTLSVNSTTGAVTQTYASDDGTSYEVFDDLVILPFCCNASAISAFYNWMTEGEREFSDLPNLSVWGSMFSGMEMTCRGKVNDFKFVKTGTENDRIVVSFELETFDGRGSVHIPAPVFYMSMDDSAAHASLVWEQSDSASQGTRTGITRNVQGKIGSCWSFDGVDDNIIFGDILDYDPGSDFCWAAWVNPDGTGSTRYLLSKRSSASTDYPYSIQIDTSNNVNFAVNGATTAVSISGVAELTVGSWSHVLCQRNGSTLEIWINGVLDASGADATGAAGNASGLVIGRQYDDASGSEFGGDIDELSHWAQALTKQQIERLYNLGYSGLSFMGNARTGA